MSTVVSGAELEVVWGRSVVVEGDGMIVIEVSGGMDVCLEGLEIEMIMIMLIDLIDSM